MCIESSAPVAMILFDACAPGGRAELFAMSTVVMLLVVRPGILLCSMACSIIQFKLLGTDTTACMVCLADQHLERHRLIQFKVLGTDIADCMVVTNGVHLLPTTLASRPYFDIELQPFTPAAGLMPTDIPL